MKISSSAIQGALRNKIDSLKMSVRYYLVLPVEHPVQYNRLTDCSLNLVEAARNQAQGFVGQFVKVLLVQTNARAVWELPSGFPLRPLKYLSRGINVLMNAGFLLSDTPQISLLIRKAGEAGMAFSGTRSSRDIHAFALSVRSFPFFPPTRALTPWRGR